MQTSTIAMRLSAVIQDENRKGFLSFLDNRKIKILNYKDWGNIFYIQIEANKDEESACNQYIKRFCKDGTDSLHCRLRDNL